MMQDRYYFGRDRRRGGKTMGLALTVMLLLLCAPAAEAAIRPDPAPGARGPTIMLPDCAPMPGVPKGWWVEGWQHGQVACVGLNASADRVISRLAMAGVSVLTFPVRRRHRRHFWWPATSTCSITQFRTRSGALLSKGYVTCTSTPAGWHSTPPPSDTWQA